MCHIHGLPFSSPATCLVQVLIIFPWDFFKSCYIVLCVFPRTFSLHVFRTTFIKWKLPLKAFEWFSVAHRKESKLLCTTYNILTVWPQQVCPTWWQSPSFLHYMQPCRDAALVSSQDVLVFWISAHNISCDNNMTFKETMPINTAVPP